MENKQIIEFTCAAPDCGRPVRFDLDDLDPDHPSLKCRACGRSYTLPDGAVRKLGLLKELIEAIRKARPILGESSVGIEVAGHKVSVPYYLLLTRMTSELALQIDDEKLDFHFIVKPLKSENKP
ncbi:MAG: hypothetical protein RAO92_02675 [Candidatus Euphemobacter frigidus]|nr:hypothetical protein [Candidatus Euphemobacter frigidus]MDP8275284.1 hypothetical protein [Candidatus Euphemobacter frigidus]